MFGRKKGGHGRKEAPQKAAKPDRRQLKTAKGMLGFDSMLKSGIVYLGDNRWSVTLLISDINYEISPEDHQLDIIDRWAGLLNGFGAGESLQINVHSRTKGVEKMLEECEMPDSGDRYDVLRRDYNRNLRHLLRSATTNTDTVKTLTVTIEDGDGTRATTTLNRMAMRLTSQLNAIDGCKATRLVREDRLRLMFETLRPYDDFTFTEERMASSRTSVKDWICPWAITRKGSKTLVLESMGRETWHRCLWIGEFPPELSDQLLSSIAGIKAHIEVSVHLEPYDKTEGLTIVKRRDAELDMEISDRRKKAEKQHLPPDMIPADLQEDKDQITALRADLQHSNQRLVNTIIVVGVSADGKEALDQTVKDVMAAAARQSCKAETLSYMQPEGLVAELPLGRDPLPMKRTLTTNAAAILVPFAAREAYTPGGIVYGRNARSGNLIAIDRRRGMNANGVFLGTSGGGKSFTVKSEMAGVFLGREDDIIVIDPEREYLPLCDAFGGSRIEVSAGGQDVINPMDLELDVDSSDVVDVVAEKAAVVTNMVGGLLGGRSGLDKVEVGLVDRCAMLLFREFRDRGGTGDQPTLLDLFDALEATGEPKGHDLAIGLEQYAKGSLSGFNGQTNVDLDNRFTVFDVHNLSGELMTFGMMVIMDQVWNRVRSNRAAGRRTWLYIDEFHRFFGNAYASEQFLDIWKRARKYGLGVTGITQDIEDMLGDESARKMLSNSDFLVLLEQTPSDADALQDLLKLSDEERAYFTGVMPGQGLMKVDTAYVPFDGRIPDDGELYRLFDTEFTD